MKTRKTYDHLLRYTDITSLISILSTNSLTLLSPANWDDKNDSYFVLKYQERKKLKSVLALCLAESNETYHHWKIFGSTCPGVSIRFNKAKLAKAVKGLAGVTIRSVEYRTLQQMKDGSIKIADLPFVKRAAFVDENEMRILFESRVKLIQSFQVQISADFIEYVTLSPWLHSSLVSPVTELLRSIEGWENLKIIRSSIVGNEAWKRYAETAII